MKTICYHRYNLLRLEVPPSPNACARFGIHLPSFSPRMHWRRGGVSSPYPRVAKRWVNIVGHRDQRQRHRSEPHLGTKGLSREQTAFPRNKRPSQGTNGLLKIDRKATGESIHRARSARLAEGLNHRSLGQRPRTCGPRATVGRGHIQPIPFAWQYTSPGQNKHKFHERLCRPGFSNAEDPGRAISVFIPRRFAEAGILLQRCIHSTSAYVFLQHRAPVALAEP